jgi:hypothetical protein
MRGKTWSMIVALVSLPFSAAPAPPTGAVVEYRGLCNASAAVAIGEGRFLVADDEDKPTTFLRVHRQGQPDPLRAPIALSNSALALDPSEDLEIDLEGSARIGDRIYWIGSHSASKNGKARPNRRRLFATRVTTAGDDVSVEVVGQPYRHLIRDLDEGEYAKFQLKDAAKLPPKDAGALSIEGLAATPEGDLLIGFRNPVPDGKALVATLKNPKGVTGDKSANLGKPIRLELGGLGVRSMEWAEALHAYLIVGGLPGEGRGSRLFRWSGDPEQKPQPISIPDLSSLNPEALYLEGMTATLLSDDGNRGIDGQLRDCAATGVARSFRGLRVPLVDP